MTEEWGCLDCVYVCLLVGVRGRVFHVCLGLCKCARVREVHRMVCVCSVHQTCRSRTPKGLTATTQTLALPLYSSTFYNTFATTCVSSQYQGSPSLSGLRAPAAHFFTSQLGAVDPPFKPLKPPTPFKLCLLHTHGKIERLK